MRLKGQLQNPPAKIVCELIHYCSLLFSPVIAQNPYSMCPVTQRRESDTTCIPQRKSHGISLPITASATAMAVFFIYLLYFKCNKIFPWCKLVLMLCYISTVLILVLSWTLMQCKISHWSFPQSYFSYCSIISNKSNSLWCGSRLLGVLRFSLDR